MAPNAGVVGIILSLHRRLGQRLVLAGCCQAEKPGLRAPGVRTLGLPLKQKWLEGGRSGKNQWNQLKKQIKQHKDAR